MFENYLIISDNHKLVILSVFVGLLLVFWQYIQITKLKSKKSNYNVAILGLSESGKTSIYCGLIYGKNFATIQTKSLIKEKLNPGFLSDNRNQLDESIYEEIYLYDTPSNFTSNTSNVNDLLKNCAAIIFVIDSTNAKSLSEAANVLYNIIYNSNFIKKKSSIAICLNKSELPEARNPNVLKTTLEREIERIRLNSFDDEYADIKHRRKKFSELYINMYSKFFIKLTNRNVHNTEPMNQKSQLVDRKFKFQNLNLLKLSFIHHKIWNEKIDACRAFIYSSFFVYKKI